MSDDTFEKTEPCNLIDLASVRADREHAEHIDLFENGRVFKFDAFDYDDYGHTGFTEIDGGGREVLLLINPREEDPRELKGLMMTRESARKLASELLEAAEFPNPEEP